MNRSHNAAQAYNSIIMAKENGFDNLSIDLIYGLPNQTLNDWKKPLAIKKLQVEHFAALLPYC